MSWGRRKHPAIKPSQTSVWQGVTHIVTTIILQKAPSCPRMLSHISAPEYQTGHRPKLREKLTLMALCGHTWSGQPFQRL